MRFNSLKRIEKYFSDKVNKTGKSVICVMAVTIVLACCLYVTDRQSELPKTEDGLAYLERNSYGEGSRTEELIVQGDELTEGTVEIEVGELEYSKEEIRDILKDAVSEVETLILAENESLDLVRSDLDLISKIPDSGIEVNWELSDYTLMDITGKLNSDHVKDGGTLLELTAVLTYQSETVRHTFTAYIYPPEMSEEERLLFELQTAVRSSEEESRSEKEVVLPEEFHGEKVTWSQPKEQRWGTVLLLGVAAASLLILRERETQKDALEKRKKQMMLDYPGIVNKLTIYTGGGMTIRNAWGRIVQDYERTQRPQEQRYAYEEMRSTWHELGDGVGERECYERFGSRCQVQAYVKLGALLAQNLRKGSKGLSELLRLEAVNAFEERKMLVRRQGEEAGTKLLMPMFLMLAVVLVIVIVPAFLSIQI